jgi:hypothetical protein
MRKMLCLIIAISSFVALAAVIRTVDNNTPSIGQYATFDAAYNASANGDTIYLYPSAFTYSSPYLQKQLTVIGAGFDPANLGMLTSKFTPAIYYETSSNCVFIGIDVGSGINVSRPETFRNCRFNSGVTVSKTGSTFQDCLFKSALTVGDNIEVIQNLAVTGCIFDFDSTHVTINRYASPIFYNCVFYGNNYKIYVPYDQSTGAFNHCLFINRGTGTQYLATGAVATATVIMRNCIFEQISSVAANFTYQYNIFEGTHAEVTDPTNMEGVNLANVMVDVNGGDYHLCTGSLAIGAGLDGVDIGIYGGVSPFDDLYYLNYLPTITDFDCPAVVDQDGNLNIHIQGKIGN